MSAIENRTQKFNKKKQEQTLKVKEAQELKSKGFSNVAAVTKMGISESTYRLLLKR